MKKINNISFPYPFLQENGGDYTNSKFVLNLQVEKNDNQIFEGYLEEFIDDNLKVKINLKGRIKRIDIKKQDIKLIRLAVKI